MLIHAIVFIVGVFAGGFGGYKVGASVERKAAAALAKAGNVIGGISGKV